jgi:hypothetical protein
MFSVVAGKALGVEPRGKQEPIVADDLKEFASGLQSVLDGPADRGFSIRLGLSVDQN